MGDVARLRLARGISSSPAFYRPLVFIAAEKGKFGLQAYELLQRKIIWKKKGWFSRSSPLLKERMVLHAALNGRVAAFNMITGEIIWQYQSPQTVTANMAMRGDTLVFCSPNGLLTALHTLDGNPLWKMELAHHVYAAPLIVRDRIYVADYRGSVWLVELATGKIRAHFEAQTPFYQPCTSDGQSIFCMGSNGILRCLSLNLQEKWQRALPGVPTAPLVVTQNHLIVTTGQKRLFVVQKDSGRVAQTIKLKRRPASAVVSGDGLVYLASEYDALFQLGKKSRRRP
jgi:outer membrane protein assembly factor BamB